MRANIRKHLGDSPITHAKLEDVWTKTGGGSTLKAMNGVLHVRGGYWVSPFSEDVAQELSEMEKKSLFE